MGSNRRGLTYGRRSGGSGNKGEALLRRTHSNTFKRVISDCYKNPTSFALASEVSFIALSVSMPAAHVA